MRIQIITIDGTLPNPAAMQVSEHYKSKSHQVGFNITDPDKVYIFCIFKENADQARGLVKNYPDTEIHIGGSGVNYDWLPEEMQKINPDYSLYDGLVCQVCGHLKNGHTKLKHEFIPGPMFYSMGFTTRGCIHKCPWCIVPEKEGKFRRWQHVKDFHGPNLESTVLLDNNIYVDKKWFFENTDYILDNDLKLDVTQGMDIRLLDKEIAGRLKELTWVMQIHFAFDNIHDEPAVRKGIELLKNAGIDIRNRVQFYVLVGYYNNPEDDKYRCRLLKELGTSPWVMRYKNTNWTNKIYRWANRKETFWSCDIDDYDHSKQRAPTDQELRSRELQSTLM